MEPQAQPQSIVTVDLRSLKERLRKKLPPDNAVLADLLREPDLMPVGRAEVLIPHYLQRLERDLERHGETGPPSLRP
ncbi:MAG: hypothetical protein ACLP9K_05235 [Nitrososphaerales archaeon]|jgi:hypothetical protein